MEIFVNQLYNINYQLMEGFDELILKIEIFKKGLTYIILKSEHRVTKTK